jgi:hypothetical protein
MVFSTDIELPKGIFRIGLILQEQWGDRHFSHSASKRRIGQAAHCQLGTLGHIATSLRVRH